MVSCWILDLACTLVLLFSRNIQNSHQKNIESWKPGSNWINPREAPKVHFPSRSVLDLLLACIHFMVLSRLLGLRSFRVHLVWYFWISLPFVILQSLRLFCPKRVSGFLRYWKIEQVGRSSQQTDFRDGAEKRARLVIACWWYTFVATYSPRGSWRASSRSPCLAKVASGSSSS